MNLLDDSTPSPRTRAFAVALLAVAALALLLRVPSIAQPLGIDQGLWASAVRGMHRGQLLYRDVWEQRPPGIYFIYLAGFRIFGWDASTVAVLDILASAATTGLLWLVGRRLGGPLAGALAAALYAALTMPSWLYGYGGFLERAVCETFISVAIAGALLCTVERGRRPKWSSTLALIAGLLVGIAVVLKPNAGLYVLALVGWLFLYEGPSARLLARLRLLAGPVTLVAAGALLPIVLVVLWLWAVGVLAEARVAVIDFNRYYVAEGYTLGAYAAAVKDVLGLRVKTDPLWLAGAAATIVAGVILVRRRRLPPLAGLAVLWGGAAALVIAVNGIRLFNSYFIQAYAPLALFTAWLVVDTERLRWRQTVAAVTLALMAVVLVGRDYVGRVARSIRADVAVLTGRMDETSYLQAFGSYANGRGYSARANAELAAYVQARTTPGDRIFLFGINGAGVYFLADRVTSHRFIRVNFFVDTEFPDPRFRLDAVVDDLRAARPRYVVFERLHTGSDPEMIQIVDGLEEHPQVALLLQHYRFDTRIEDFTLYRLRSPGLDHER